jgi:hypothetical protein
LTNIATDQLALEPVDGQDSWSILYIFGFLMCSFQLDPDARALTCSHLIQTKTVTIQQSQKSAPMSLGSLLVAEMETVDVHHLQNNDIHGPHSRIRLFSNSALLPRVKGALSRNGPARQVDPRSLPALLGLLLIILAYPSLLLLEANGDACRAKVVSAITCRRRKKRNTRREVEVSTYWLAASG